MQQLSPPLRHHNVEIMAIDPSMNTIVAVVHLDCLPQDVQTPESLDRVNAMLYESTDYLIKEGFIAGGRTWRNRAVIRPTQKTS